MENFKKLVLIYFDLWIWINYNIRRETWNNNIGKIFITSLINIYFRLWLFNINNEKTSRLGLDSIWMNYFK